MNLTAELNGIVIQEVYRLNQKFVHELWPSVTEDNFPEFIRCYDCLLNRKWREYQELN